MTLRPHHVELDGGIVRHSTDKAVIGKRHFFVDLVEDDGGHVPIWDGEHMGDAIRQAHAARREFGLPYVVDRYAGGKR